MASGISFKQQCPSCEAMVPIRDAGLIGRKIDCPKCKYRFVVEEPAEEEEADAPAKKSDKVATGKTGGKNGAAVKAGGPRQKEGVAKPGAKKKGASPVLIIGGGLAVVALVAIVIALVAMSSGGTKDNPGGSGGGGPGGQTGNEEEKEKEKE